MAGNIRLAPIGRDYYQDERSGLAAGISALAGLTRIFKGQHLKMGRSVQTKEKGSPLSSGPVSRKPISGTRAGAAT